MRAQICVAIAVASVFGCNSAWSACPKGKLRDCVVNLGVVPQISQQIVAGEKIAAPAKPLPIDPPAHYTGPTIGAAPLVGRAPEVGYRWAIN